MQRRGDPAHQRVDGDRDGGCAPGRFERPADPLGPYSPQQRPAAGPGPLPLLHHAQTGRGVRAPRQSAPTGGAGGHAGSPAVRWLLAAQQSP